MCRFDIKVRLNNKPLKIYAFSTSAVDNGEWSAARYYISNTGRKIPLLTEVEVLADIDFVAHFQ